MNAEEEQRYFEGQNFDKWEEEQYFGSYGTFEMQKSMLLDERRNRAFRLAIEGVMSDDKVVLDVGCGTGLLSLFAARAGARRVYAVEKSDMAWHAHKIVEANGFANVFVTQQKAEDLELGEQVDVIVRFGLFCCFSK